MILTCENCNARFNLDENLIKESGSKVRCSKCHHIFTVYKSAPAEEPGPFLEPEEAPEEAPEFGLEEPEEIPVEEEISLEEVTLEEEPAVGEPTLVEEEMALEEAPEAEEEVPEEPPELDLEEPKEIPAEEEISLEEVTFEEEPAVEEEIALEEAPEAVEEVPEEAPAEEIAEPVEEADEEALEADLEEPEEKPIEEEIAAEAPSVEEEVLAEEAEPETEVREEPEEELPGAVSEEPAEEPEEEQPMPPPVVEKEPAWRRISTPVMIGLVLVLLAGGAFGAYTLLRSFDVKIPFLESLTGAPESTAIEPGNLRITLVAHLIKGEFVENSVAGSLFVIKGKVRNDYPEARNFIMVKGVIYTKDGKPVKKKKIYCGNLLSDSDLQALDKATIDKRLRNKFGDERSNFKIPSGKVVPFVVVFSDLPQELGEFSVEVVSSAPA